MFASNITTWITDRDDDDILANINTQDLTLTVVAAKTITTNKPNQRPTLKVTTAQQSCSRDDTRSDWTAAMDSGATVSPYNLPK